MPRRSAAVRQTEASPDPSLPAVLIPPSQAKAEQKEAYWIQLLDNPEELRKAVGTSEFFPLLREFPQTLWGDRLSIYVYRMPDDEGLMVKNPVGAKKYIKPIMRQPIDEDWLANRHGGGKYLLYLKLDDKDTLKETTVRIDGPPKVQPGQIVEMEGKVVPVGAAAAPAPAADARSDVATIIDANSKAEEKRMEMVLQTNKATIDMVKEQAAGNTQRDPITIAIELVKLIQPQPQKDPALTALEMMDKMESIIARRNPQHTEPADSEDPPIDKAIALLERTTGKNFSDLMRGSGSRPAAAQQDSWGWVAPVVGAAKDFISQLPAILEQTRRARAEEFSRQVWLRTAQPGQTPPAELLASNAPPPASRPSAVPSAPVVPSTADPMQLATVIVEMVCHGFDQNPLDGQETAAAIAFVLGKQIEATGLAASLADAENLQRLIAGTPELEQRSKDVRWAEFQQEFVGYMTDRFGVDPGHREPAKPAEPQSAA